MLEGLQCFAEREMFSKNIRVYLRTVIGQKFAFGEPVLMQAREEGMCGPPPTFELEPAAAQHLMDQLWHCGLRPSEGTGSAGSLAATERHLADFRAIAFGLLEKNGVKKP